MTTAAELAFEEEICSHLAGQGWLHADGDAALYDRARALFPPDLIAWIQATQPDACAALVKSRGPAAEAALLDRVRKQLDDRGTLEVMRHGVELIDVRGLTPVKDAAA